LLEAPVLQRSLSMYITDNHRMYACFLYKQDTAET